MNIKKIIQNLLLSTGLFLITSAGSAFAASGYVVTETTGTVGTAQSYEIEYKVDDAVQTWAAGDTLTIQLPANYPQWGSLTFTAEVDQDVTNNATTETQITSGLGNGQYVASGDTLQIKWGALAGDWVVAVGDTTTIRILITAGAAPTYLNATSTFTFAGTTAAADTNPSGTGTVNVAAEPQLTASVSLGLNSVVGTAGSTTLLLTPPVALAATDTIVFTMPTNFFVPDGAITVASQTLAGGGTFTCTGVLATRVITCTTSGVITADVAGNIVMSGLESKWDSSGATNIADLTINAVAAGAGADIGLDATVAVDDTTPEPQLIASVSLGLNSVVGTAGSTTLTMTSPRILAATDTIVFTMPTNFSVPQGAITMTDGTLAGAGGITCTGVAATRVITCTTDGVITADTEGAITMSGIQSIWDSETATNIADLTINNVAAGGGLDIGLDATVAVTDTTPEPQLIASVSLGLNSVVGTAGSTTLTMTSPRALAATDTIVFTMPNNFSIPNGAITMTDGTLAGAGGITCTGVLATRVITCTTDGVITADTEGAITMSGILAIANSSGATNIADLTINAVATGGGLDIGLDATVAVADTTVGALSAGNVEPQTLMSGVESANTISLTTAVTIPNLGQIVITYPTGWSVAGASGKTAQSLSGLDGTWTVTVSGLVVTLTQTGGGATSAGSKSFIIPQGIMPPSGNGAGGTYTITTQNVAGLSIETNAAIASDVIAGGTSGGSVNETSATTTTTTSTTSTTISTTTPATTTTTTTTTPATTTTEDNNPVPSEENTVSVETKTGEVVMLTDLPETFWGTDVIQAMVSAGIVKGNEDGTFKPNSNLNRAEASALLYRVMGLEEPMVPEMKPFSDVETGEWYAGYVSELKDRKVANGNPDGTYKPGNSINRAEFLKLSMNLYTYLADDGTKAEVEALEKGPQTTAFKDLDTSAWYSSTVTAATAKGFIGGKACGEDKCFEATASITRAEATQVLYNMFGKMLQVELPTE